MPWHAFLFSRLWTAGPDRNPEPTFSEEKMNRSELMKKVKEDGVRFVSYQFTDINGTIKSVDAPVEQLAPALADGVWFDGSSVEGFARIQESDMHLRLDPDSYAVLTWTNPELRRARVFCDIYTPSGEPFEGDPRGTLRRILTALEKRGWSFNVGPEPEFFLFRGTDGNGVHPTPHDNGSYFDFSSDDEAAHVRASL